MESAKSKFASAADCFVLLPRVTLGAAVMAGAGSGPVITTSIYMTNICEPCCAYKSQEERQYANTKCKVQA